jgi:hypothetical protein
MCFSKFVQVGLALIDRDMVVGLCESCDPRHDASAATEQKYMNLNRFADWLNGVKWQFVIQRSLSVASLTSKGREIPL